MEDPLAAGALPPDSASSAVEMNSALREETAFAAFVDGESFEDCCPIAHWAAYSAVSACWMEGGRQGGGWR